METETKIPNYTIQDVRITPEEVDAIITNICIKKNKDIFKETKYDQEVERLVFTVENDEYKINVDIPMSMFPLNEVPDRSNLGKFLKKYGKLETSMQVKIKIKENGFWKFSL